MLNLSPNKQHHCAEGKAKFTGSEEEQRILILKLLFEFLVYKVLGTVLPLTSLLTDLLTAICAMCYEKTKQFEFTPRITAIIKVLTNTMFHVVHRNDGERSFLRNKVAALNARQ